jgi:hypothetical protein
MTPGNTESAEEETKKRKTIKIFFYAFCVVFALFVFSVIRANIKSMYGLTELG